MADEEELSRVWEEVENLKQLHLKQHQELLELRKENRLLRERLEGKPITEAEQRLLRIAKGIIAEIGEGADSSNVGEGTGQAHIYVSGHTETKQNNRQAYYKCLVVDEMSQTTELTLADPTAHTTANRAVIAGIIAGIALIKKPCKIVVVTNLNFGLSKLAHPNGPNKDVLRQLKEILHESNHEVTFEINPEQAEKKMKSFPKRKV